MYGTVKIKEVIALMDKELGTAWKSGTAAEIIATIEAYVTAIDLTAGLTAASLTSDTTVTATTGVSGATLKATGAAPGTQTASTVVIGQKDSSVGAKATIDLELEEDVVAVGTFTPSHKVAIWLNGVEYQIQMQAVV